MIPAEFDIQSYDYWLPEERIAAFPAEVRDGSRLLAVRISSGEISHHLFREIEELLKPGDCLVVNDTRVFRARFFGKKESGGRVELLFLHYPRRGDGRAVVNCLTRSSKPLRKGQHITIGPDFTVEVLDRPRNGQVMCAVEHSGDLDAQMERYGHVPLPPYIRRDDTELDGDRYQTVYAAKTGSVAAPTAGLHFSKRLLDSLEKRGIEVVHLTLHVGYGTFAPIRCRDIREHRIHEEWVEVPEWVADRIRRAKNQGRRVVAVGTTAVRALETAAIGEKEIRPYAGFSSLYIYHGYRFKVVDAIITNFHLPKSSLLVLVSAFAGRELIMRAYQEALDAGYRFYSYGDAMFIMP